MSAIALNRKARRANGGKSRSRAIVGAAAVTTTAAALVAGVSAPAGTNVVSIPNIKLAADPINVDLITTGGLFGLVNALGYDSIPLSIPNPIDPTKPPFVINVNLNYTDNNPQNLYNAINALPMTPTGSDPTGIVCAGSDSKDCRFAPVVTIGDGVSGVRDAMNSLWSAALGTQLLPGYTPLKGGQTTTLSVLINDVLRPNGGISARFGTPNSSLPDTGAVPDGAGKTDPKASNAFLDLTWEYNPQADFPVTFNPLALLNSAMAGLPPIVDLLDTKPLDIFENQIAYAIGVGGKTYAPGDAEGQTAVFGNLLPIVGGITEDTVPQLFATLVPGTIPLLGPAALGTYLTNSLLKRINSPFLFGDPLSDVLTPMLKILVNVAYPDVVTPTAIKANPDLAAYGAYGRTFLQQDIKFGSMNPLTRQEQQQVAGDAWNAFTTALTEQFKKPFFGIVVPNTIPGQTAATPAAAKAAPAAAAAVAAAPVVEAPAPAAAAVSAPTVSEPAENPAPVVDSAPKVVTPDIEVSAPKVVAPDIEIVPAAEAPLSAKAPAPASPTRRGGSSAKSGAGSDTPGHRGSGHSASSGSN